MKRKIVNGFLLMAFFVSSVSMFVSCKDYDEDVYVDLKSQLAKEKSLRELLQQQVDELEAFAKSIEQCKCNLEAELAGYLTKAEADETYLKKDELEGYINEVTNLRNTINGLQGQLDAINERLDNLKSGLTEDDVNKLIENNALIQQLVSDIKALGSCNCNLEELTGRLDDLEALAAGLPETIATLMQTANDAYALATTNAGLIDAQNQTIDELKKQIEELQKKINNLPSGGSCTCTGTGSCTCTGNGSCSCNLNEIWTKLGDLESELNNKATKEELEEVKTELERTITEAKNLANDAWQKALENEGAITILNGTVGELQESLETVIADVAELDTRLTNLEDEVTELSNTVTELEGKVNKLVEDLQNMITGIIVQAAESPVLGYLNTPFGLNNTVLAVYYGKPIEKWQFPSLRQPNYVNVDEYEKWFEDNYRRLDVLGVETFADLDDFIKDHDANSILVTDDGAVGNAGTLYLTVNPANVDFKGQTLKLKDSQDNDAPAVLAPLAHSDRTLNFGFTRAEGNGFYEAKATISADNVDNAKIKVDFNAIKDDIKNLLQDRTKSNVLELGATVLNSTSNVLPAYGVAASWTDESMGEHNIYSQYNVAATAVKPLSFSFLQDWKGINSMPGLDRLQNLVGQIVNKIKIDLNLNLPDFTKYADVEIEFGNIEMPEVGDKFKIEFRLKLTNDDGDMFVPVVYPYNGKLLLLQIKSNDDDEYYVYAVYEQDANGRYVEVDKNKYDFSDLDGILSNFLVREIDFSEEMESTMQEIIDSINASINGSGINDTLKDLFNDIAAIGDLDGQISGAIEDAKNDIKSTINSYISRINDKLTKWINRAPGLLRITMIANSGNNIGLLSMSKYMPTKASGTVTLFPTTYNLELLTPTYKKFVAVTDVFDANGTRLDLSVAQTKAAAANSGKNMRKVIDGTTTCELKGEAGYIYEVTYTAVDYFGKVSLRNYYVKF